MKAFMSSIGNELEMGRFARPWTHMERMAVREIRAILAETEPFVPSRDEFKVGRFSNTEHSSIGTLAMCSPMYQALAEALAAFVAEEE